ncbi:MAG: DNA polymerase III subunit delta [Pseudoflavonifractor sp.]
MNLSALAGNAPLKAQLDHQTDRRGLSHAYILAGPAGSGRHTLAGILAAGLLCAAPDPALRPCGTCPACRKALAGIHPDCMKTGILEEKREILVGQIRTLRSDAYIRPNEAQRKVYLIENAETMKDSAQNAMLKLLEEGPSYAAFLLLTDNAGGLLETVRSRCETLSLAPVTEAEALDYLQNRFPEQSPDLLTVAAERCHGLLGRAISALEPGGGASAKLRDGALGLVSAFAAKDELALLRCSMTLEKWDKDSFSGLFDETILLLRDGLVLQAGGAAHEPDPERAKVAGALARAISAPQLFAAVALMERLREACRFNAGGGHLCGWLCGGLSTLCH